MIYRRGRDYVKMSFYNMKKERGEKVMQEFIDAWIDV